MKIEFPAWRLIIEEMASLTELKTVYDYDDVAKLNALLNMKIDLQETEAEKIKAVKGKK